MDFLDQATRAGSCRAKVSISSLLSITWTEIAEFFRRECREKYRQPWQLTDEVVVFSMTCRVLGPGHETNTGIAWSTRVLRRFAPLAAGGGVCKFTDSHPLQGAKSAESSPITARLSAMSKSFGQKERTANRELGTPDLELRAQYTANASAKKAQIGRSPQSLKDLFSLRPVRNMEVL